MTLIVQWVRWYYHHFINKEIRTVGSKARDLKHHTVLPSFPVWFYFYDRMLTPLCPTLTVNEFIALFSIVSSPTCFHYSYFYFFWPQGIRFSKVGTSYLPQPTEKKKMPSNYHHLNWGTPCSLKGVHNEFSQDRGIYPKYNMFWQWNLLRETLPLVFVSTEHLIIPTVRMFSGELLAFAPGRVEHYFHFQTCLGLGIERHGRVSQHQRRLEPKGTPSRSSRRQLPCHSCIPHTQRNIQHTDSTQ